MPVATTTGMCFFTSQGKRAEEIARKYGRRMNIVEAAREILAEQEAAERAAQVQDPKHKTDIFGIRLNDGMIVSPAYAEPLTVIVSGSDQLQVMRWGLIPRGTSIEKKEIYNKKNLYKNARAENIFTTWPWKFVTQNRCIYPVTGFFEPHEFPDGRKQYFYVHEKHGEGFSIAGLWDEWQHPKTGEKIKTFVMLTIAANEKLRWVHNSGKNPFRMPLIIPDEKVEQWLDPELDEQGMRQFLTTPPDDNIVVWPVRLKFNQGDPYDHSIIDEVPPVQLGFDF